MAMLRRLRQLILTPPVSVTRIARRGFHAKGPDAVVLLETIGQSFLTGYRYAVGSPTIADARAHLETISRRFRGFAYEGAAMGYAVLDGLRIGRRAAARDLVPTFLAGPGERHIYMAYVGIGWALARLPRWRWRRLAPADPLLRWLVLDGYGFHQAYFRTRRYVDGQYQDPGLAWPAGDPDSYTPRAVDQGIGRALWFVEGTDVDRVATRIGTFRADRRRDLWAGAGLAATYAGGVDEPELRRFWSLAGRYRPEVAQACAFAAEARLRAGLLTAHTELATGVFCGMPPQAAAGVTVETRSGLPAHGPVPAYEIWRDRTAQRFAALGRC